MIAPDHAQLGIAFEWVALFLAGLLLVSVLLIGIGHFHQFIHNWWKEQKDIWADHRTHVR